MQPVLQVCVLTHHVQATRGPCGVKACVPPHANPCASGGGPSGRGKSVWGLVTDKLRPVMEQRPCALAVRDTQALQMGLQGGSYVPPVSLQITSDPCVLEVLGNSLVGATAFRLGLPIACWTTPEPTSNWEHWLQLTPCVFKDSLSLC